MKTLSYVLQNLLEKNMCNINTVFWNVYGYLKFITPFLYRKVWKTPYTEKSSLNMQIIDTFIVQN